MYRLRSKGKDRTSTEIKVILRDTKETVDVPYPVVNGYVIAKSLQNPRIHNITIYKNLLGFSYDDYHCKFDLGNGGDLWAVFFEEEYNFRNRSVLCAH